MNFTNNESTVPAQTGQRFIQIFLLILILIGIGLLATQRLWVPSLVAYLLEREVVEQILPIEEVATSTPAFNSKNITISIDGQSVTLVDGVSSVATTPGSASSVVTQYFGNEVTVDLDLDGHEDKVFLVTSDGGGSGVFFYVVGALYTESGYIGTEAVFLGDRIAPQATEIGKNNTIVVQYADRAVGESFAVSPAVGKSLVLKFASTTRQLVPVEQDPAPVADASSVSLTAKGWEWVSVVYADGSIVTPKKPGIFTVTFAEDGSFGVTTDCNHAGGKYTTTGDTLTLGNIFSTELYCEGSQEKLFTSLLGEVSKYHIISKGELVLDLTSGAVVNLR